MSYWLRAEFTGASGTGNIIRSGNSKKIKLNYPCESISTTTCSALIITLVPGIYNISLFGAKGGDTINSKGGKGGMASGILSLPKTHNFQLFIGGKGVDQTGELRQHPGGYNGGGSSNHDRGSGGGMTDLQIEQNGIFQSIIIAGAGGGGHQYLSESMPAQNGGDGGGLNGTFGGYVGIDIPCYGTQTNCEGGAGHNEQGTQRQGSHGEVGGGGGAGYWGGGSASNAGSSGGSSFISELLSSHQFITGCNNNNGFAIFEIIVGGQQTCNFSPLNKKFLIFFFTSISIKE